MLVDGERLIDMERPEECKQVASGRRLVVTMAIGNGFPDLAALAMPGHRAYAERIRADYLVLQDRVIAAPSPYYEIFQLYRLFEGYDRILYLDLDVLVREDCPDLFERVPRDLLGVFFESRLVDRSKEIQRIETLWSPIHWSGDYFNNGVMVLSRLHRDLFKIDREFPRDLAFFDQTLINYLAVASNTRVYDIGVGFNYMSVLLGRGRIARVLLNDVCRGALPVPWLYQVRPEPQNAFIVHLAGYGAQSKLRMARRILANWAEGVGGSVGPAHGRLNRVFHGLVPSIADGASPPPDQMARTLWPLCDGTHTADDLLSALCEICPGRSKGALWKQVRRSLNAWMSTGAVLGTNQAG